MSMESYIAILKQRYPSHCFTNISLEDCSSYGVEFEALLGNKGDRLQDIVSSIASATSRADFIEIARRRLVVAFAKKHACDGILFGDSTTRLAERTLSETAKGRGIAIPWLTADGSSDGINCIYPMRDLLRKELTAYVGMTTPLLASLILGSSTRTPSSSKDTTVDGLMSQFFESVEANYPSIVANVVRTSGRLVAPSVPEDEQLCSICGQPVFTGSWGGDQQSVTSSQSIDSNGSQNGRAKCYGCARILLRP
jgi:cytoplasmic tRNA 2-thiolation protein 2